MATYRKIVQIAVAAVAERGGDSKDVLAFDRVFALCDDGSFWLYRWPEPVVDGSWERLRDIPQD
jgi:hypothetical protein